MPRKPLLTALLLALATLAGGQQAMMWNNSHSTLEPAPAGHHFLNGEVLRYDAEWRLWKAGTAVLRMDAAGESQHLTATAEATGAVALLYPVNDRFESYFDRRTFCSQKVLKHAEEGLHKRETTLTFDPRGLSILDERNLRSGEHKHQESDSPVCVTDVLSGIYYLGARRLEPGTTILFPMSDGGKTVDVKAYVEGREEVKTDAGAFKTVRVGISSDAGALKGRGKLWIWYTDDSSHLPVQMRSHLFWGTMTLRLTRLEK
jgi:hypothetical protein